MFTLYSLGFLVIARAVPFRPCNVHDLLRVTSVDVEPAHPAPGAAMSVVVNGTADFPCVAAAATVEAEVYGVKVGRMVFDWCDAGMTCPLTAGDPFSVEMQYVSRHRPPTTWTSRWRWSWPTTT